MKKISIFLFFYLSFFLFSLAQTTVRSYDDFSYSIGDTIQIGHPRYSYGDYSFILYPEITNNVNYYKKLKVGQFPFTLAVIEKISPTEENKLFSYSEKSPLLQVRNIDKSDSILYINLDYAIAQKEIVRNLKQQPSETALKTHTLLAFHHKIYKTEITDETLLQYISSKDQELGKECNGSKFKFQKIKEEWKTALLDEMENLDFNKLYFIEEAVKHSEYDFEKSAYWIYYDTKQYEKENNIIECNPYYFLLRNTEKKNLLLFPPDAAEQFEISQKGISYYSWSGTLYARIFFRFSKEPVVHPRTDRGIARSIIYEDKLMNVDIQTVDIFDHHSYQYNYIGTIH